MLSAGAARTDITPPVGIAHAGWGAAIHEAAEGIDMPFYATALFVMDGDIEVAILDLDILILPGSLADDIRSAIASRVGIDPDHVWVSYTHTHSGAEFPDTWLKEGKELIAPYQDALPGKVAEAAAQAKGAITPVRVGSGVGHSNINVNRRPTNHDGFVFTGRNWDGVVDHSVNVVGLDDEDGAPVATILNFQCHPTVLGPANRLLSPDYPGHARATVERNIGGLCLFMQGAAGNQGPVDGFSGDVEVARKLGLRLGLEAARVRAEIDPFPRKERLVEIVASGADLGMYEDDITGEPDDTLQIGNHIAELPAAEFPPLAVIQATLDQRAAELVEVRKTGDEDAIKDAVMLSKRAWIQMNLARSVGGATTVPTRIQVIRLGSIAFVGTPVEAFAEVGLAIKEASPARQTIFAGYANESFGYMPMVADYEIGGYEPRTTPFHAGSGEQMIAECGEVLEELWADG